MYIFAYFLVYWIIYEKSIKGLVCWSHLNSYRRVRLKSVLIPVCFFLQDFWNLILMMLNFNAAHIHFQWTFSTWKEEKPCSPGTKEIFMPQARIDLATLRFSGYNVRSLKYSEGREFDSRLGYEKFCCPGRAWFLLLSS